MVGIGPTAHGISEDQIMLYYILTNKNLALIKARSNLEINFSEAKSRDLWIKQSFMLDGAGFNLNIE